MCVCVCVCVKKTEERDITISKPFETIHLFSEQSLKKVKENKFQLYSCRFNSSWHKTLNQGRP